jgi:3-deoxy-7-phosphoheptulonate synthase
MTSAVLTGTMITDWPFWRFLHAAQQPEWPNPILAEEVIAELSGYPPLVWPAECDRLRDRLAMVADGEAFLLQGGDCAETFSSASAGTTSGKVRTLTDMATILERGAGVPVVTVGRIAGQYAKPRSATTETKDGVTLPAYRGDAVNGLDFSLQARGPDPDRLLRAYRNSAATLGHIQELGREFYTSHEALLLGYESALARTNPVTGRCYGTSGHLLWIGERTRRVDGAHVAFAASIRNPVGVKLGPTATADDVLALVDLLDPDQERGRLTLITRHGADKVRDVLPTLVEKVRASGAPVTWVCDPMHGNTVSASGRKTRRFDDVLDEIAGFFEVHHALGTYPGGLHLEVTGEDVTECVGGSPPVAVEELHRRYETACDPRLNRAQALELAALVADLFRPDTRSRPVGSAADQTPPGA